MKVLFINHAENGGGAEQFTKSLFQHTPDASLVVGSKVGIDEARYLSDNALSSTLSITDKFVQKVSRFRGVHHLLGLHDSYHQTYKRLSKMTEYQQSNLVHLNNLHGGWFDLDALGKIDKDKPVVWTLHDMWCMTGGEAYVFDHKGYETGDWNTPYIDYHPLRGPLVDNRKRYLNQKKSLYSSLRNTIFVPVSDWLSNCLKSAYVYNSGMVLRTIKNGVDLSVFNNRGRSTGGGIKNVLFFNNESPFKGADIGIEVLRGLESKCNIFVIGSKAEHLGKHQYLGYSISDREKLADVYRRMDILLFPSLAENMPLTVLEAMACGVVPVAGAVGGIPEIVLDGDTGFLASSPTAHELSIKMEDAFAQDLTPMSNRAQSFVHEFHDFDNMLKQYRALYSELCS